MNVKVTLKTVISDENNREHIDVSAEGKYYEKDETYVLLFNEKDPDGNNVRNMITISEDKVVVKRTGHVKMNQIFREGQRTESTYYHPFGTMRMETETKQIDFNRENNGRQGSLDITYLLRLNEQEPQNHQLSLTYKREATK